MIVGAEEMKFVDNQESGGEKLVKKEKFFFNRFRLLYSLF